MQTGTSEMQKEEYPELPDKSQYNTDDEDLLLPPHLSAEQKIDRIDQLMDSMVKKIRKPLKRRLQNRRSALKSRLRKQTLINQLSSNKESQSHVIVRLETQIEQLQKELSEAKKANQEKD